MDHPYGHHHHERRDYDDDDDHDHERGEKRPPQHHRHQQQQTDQSRPPTQVSHVAHEPTIPIKPEAHHGFRPHLHQTHDDESANSYGAGEFDLSNKPTYKVFCKAAPDFHLTIRDGEVVLAPYDQSDRFQNWFKDEKYSTLVKDEERAPCFSLINKATAQAIKHSIGATHPVQLAPYNPDVIDESLLWTLSKEFGDGYRCIRMVNNVNLNMDAFRGDTKSSGVHDGTTIVLWKWNKGDNQLWKVVPHPICK